MAVLDVSNPYGSPQRETAYQESSKCVGHSDMITKRILGDPVLAFSRETLD